MKYIFNYKDGRNYDDSIIDGFRLETVKNQKGDILMKIYSFQKNKIEMTLDNNEAIAIAHSLLVATNSVKKVSIEAAANLSVHLTGVPLGFTPVGDLCEINID